MTEKEERATYQRAWCKKNPKARAAINKRYYDKNKVYLIKESTKRYNENKESLQEKARSRQNL